MPVFGVDISEWQEGVSLQRLKDEGAEFVILRCGASFTGTSEPFTDGCFEDFYNEAKRVGLGVGVYWFSAAYDVEAAKREADYCLCLLDGKQFEYPIWYDVETATHTDMISSDPGRLADIIFAFCERVESAGYWCGIYSWAWLIEPLGSKLDRFDRWICDWTGDEPSAWHGMWQFGGSTNPIRSCEMAGYTIDQNYSYKDYPSLMRQYGLNGYAKDEPAPTPAPAPEPVYEGPTPDDIVNIADGELDAPNGEKYWNYVFGGGYVNGVLTPYCACFDSWVYGTARANIPFWPRGYAFDEGDRGEIGSQWVDKYSLEKGDSLAFDWDWDGLGDHVGIVRGRYDWGCATTEGNSTGSPVSHQQRTWDNIIGGIRPIYGSSPFPPPTPHNNRDGGQLDVDGDAGWNTIIDLQHAMGTHEDGVISGQSWADADYHWAISAVQYDEMGSQCVMAIQRMVGANVDGKWGPETSRKFQQFLIARGYSCGAAGADGYFGRDSVKALQRWLNDGAPR